MRLLCPYEPSIETSTHQKQSELFAEPNRHRGAQRVEKYRHHNSTDELIRLGFGDGGIVGIKPYCAWGNYINRMSDSCQDCRYGSKKATGDDACPFATLYRDFLSCHRQKFAGDRRMGYQLNNLDRKDDGERRSTRNAADAQKSAFTEKTYSSQRCTA